MSKVHNVQQGETLAAIAMRYLGSSSKWTKITGANSQLVSRRKATDDSPYIFPGDTLIIPEDQTESRPASAVTIKPIILSDKE
ncbi:MAG: LysM peptidoglycan-binding domain-containing protein [Treponema sp.]|jgi:nucleoid-associated protein YgaU|nr:LysM peptidoglycan-binding domain-containing protein [Treponema sp.]